MVKIHNIKFYKPEPRSIYCMSLQQDQSKLALLRKDSSIEIWNLRNLPYIERTIPCILHYNIQAIIWSKHRLFSCTLQGFLYEYDLQALTYKHKETVTGEAAFCLDVDKSNCNLVVGTENGYLNIFDISGNEIKYIKFLDKQEGRILCVKYDCTGNFLVSGGIDAIRIWDVKNRNALYKMTTGRSEIHKSTIVWCLEVTRDFTIISGDSRGKLTFWDGKIGSQIVSYQSHKADILSLTLSEDENTLFCAGVDATIISYTKINIKEQNHKWVKNIQRKVHDHDVRALAIVNEKLYSGGIDGYLACTYHPPKTVLKYPPLLQNNSVAISKYTKLILLQYPDYIEIWKLGSVLDGKSESAIFQLKNDAKKLLHLEHSLKDDCQEKYRENIICSSISPNGKWIAFSNISTCKLYDVDFDNIEKPHIKPVKPMPETCEPSIKLAFTPDNSSLILATLSGSLTVISLKDMSLVQKIETTTFFSDIILHLVIASNGKYLVAADTDSNINVWIKNKDFWKYHCKLPKYNCAPTSLAIQPDTCNLWIAYSDHKVVEYNLNGRQFSDFTKSMSSKKIKEYANKYFPIRNITFNPVDKNIILLHDDTNIVTIQKNKISSQPLPKMPRISQNKEQTCIKQNLNCFSSYKKYQHLLHLESISEDEIVAVEVNPLLLMEQLPPCLKQNTFGTK